MLWLALAAVFYRALIPFGFMPASAAQVRQGAVLVLCSGGLLQTVESLLPGKSGMHAYSDCGFAAAAASGLPPAAPAAPVFNVAYGNNAIYTPRLTPAPQLTLPPARGPPALQMI